MLRERKNKMLKRAAQGQSPLPLGAQELKELEACLGANPDTVKQVTRLIEQATGGRLVATPSKEAVMRYLLDPVNRGVLEQVLSTHAKDMSLNALAQGIAANKDNPGLKNIMNNAGYAPKDGFINNARKLALPFMGAGITALTAGIGIYKLINKLKNDQSRMALIEDLARNDAVLKDVDKQQLMEWYATIYHFAPQFSLDKAAVREVLQNFARFGRLDVNTVKMIAETEKATQDADSKQKGWGGFLQTLNTTIGWGGV